MYPGRICSAELIGCEMCHYHGTCYSRGEDQVLCECFHWYAGTNCHINLKGFTFLIIKFGVNCLNAIMFYIVYISFVNWFDNIGHNIVCITSGMHHNDMCETETTTVKESNARKHWSNEFFAQVSGISNAK